MQWKGSERVSSRKVHVGEGIGWTGEALEEGEIGHERER